MWSQMWLLMWSLVRSDYDIGVVGVSFVWMSNAL